MGASYRAPIRGFSYGIPTNTPNSPKTATERQKNLKAIYAGSSSHLTFVDGNLGRLTPDEVPYF